MQTKDSPDVEHLWRAWVHHKETTVANELIKNYMYLVDYHVEQMGKKIPKAFDKGNLKSFGLIGLFDAINKFNPGRGLKFDTYGSIRIRGAIVDGLRKEDWLPRGVRDQIKHLEKTVVSLEQQLQRSPTDAEIAASMQIDETEVNQLFTAAHSGFKLSLDNLTEQNKNNAVYPELIGMGSIPTPETSIEGRELRLELIDAIKQLKKNEQLVISLFYIEELTFTEIGKVIGLSTSRISQIHKCAIEQLKNKMGDM